MLALQYNVLTFAIFVRLNGAHETTAVGLRPRFEDRCLAHKLYSLIIYLFHDGLEVAMEVLTRHSHDDALSVRTYTIITRLIWLADDGLAEHLSLMSAAYLAHDHSCDLYIRVFTLLLIESLVCGRLNTLAVSWRDARVML